MNRVIEVSYFEWAQNKAGYTWEEDEVYSRLESSMTRAFNAVCALMEDRGIDMRTAAYAHALIRIGEAIEAQGTSR